MVLAYLRRDGLIEPYYPNGLRSRIRESLVLDAISCEMAAKVALDQRDFHAAILPLMGTTAAREEQVNRMIELFSASQCYSELDRKKALSILKREARKTAAEVYEILKKYNYWDTLPDFTPAQYREIIGRINELKQAQESEKDGSTN